MDKDSLIKNLHPLEVRVLLNFVPGQELDVDTLVEKLGYKIGQANQAFSWLIGKELLTEKSRTTRFFYEITDFGRDAQAQGTVEEKMINLVAEKGSLAMTDLAKALGVEQKDMGSAFGSLTKEGVLAMDSEKKVSPKSGQPSPRMTLIRSLLDKGASRGILDESSLTPEQKDAISTVAKKRGAGTEPFRYVEKEMVIFTLLPAASEATAALKEKGITGEEVGLLTSSMLSDGSWKTKTFRSFNVNQAPARTYIGRRNPYQEFIMSVKDKLVSLGFEEFDGPLVETEFWNGDALFMPQFHAARDIHDVYYVKNPTHAKSIEQPWLDNVAGAHTNGGDTGSRGWGYNFDRDFTRRLILRSQGTVLSAKQLPKAKIPGKYFGVARCFRYDQVDATHGADFYQTEGIVLGEDVNLRTLLGLLKMFAIEVAGATEVKYVPGYFPFTEPSIEIHIKHPKLGWMEMGGSGIFRPEVTKSMGIDVPVLAWGLGIDRMAMMSLNINDIRDLFTPDIETVRLRKRN